MKVYLDLDGVLAEFHDSAFDFFGREVVRPRQYDIVAAMDMHADDFWHSLDYGFWSRLPWTTEGRALFEGVLDLVDEEDVHILSSPSWTSGCLAGKADWVKNNLGKGYQRRLHLTAAKHAVAGPGKVLVDDFDSNVDGFVKHKGKAVLVPRQWNSRKRETVHDGRFDVAAILRELRKVIGS